MPRPKQLKQVDIDAFTAPAQDEVILGADESYALFLKDLQKLHQQECADKMGISRQAFQQLLDSAHKKTAQALLSGARLKVSGGEFVTPKCEMTCSSCGTQYMPHLLRDKKNCPQCGSEQVACHNKGSHCHLLGCPSA
jgi:predicted DNA-binding protein (UPF0251 family)